MTEHQKTNHEKKTNQQHTKTQTICTYITTSQQTTMSSMEAAFLESDLMGDLDPEEMMSLLGENAKLENVQKMLKESIVDSDFYNKFDDDFDDQDLS